MLDRLLPKLKATDHRVCKNPFDSFKLCLCCTQAYLIWLLKYYFSGHAMSVLDAMHSMMLYFLTLGYLICFVNFFFFFGVIRKDFIAK